MGEVSVGELLQEGVRLHQAQALDDAEKIYDAILAREKANPDALNLKGTIALQRGRVADAVALLERAVAALPSFAAAQINYGRALAAADRKDEAIAALKRGLQLQPTDAGANVAISALLAERGEHGDAAVHLRAALDAATSWSADLRAELTSNLGDYLRRDKQFEEAIRAQREALALRPENALISFNLAIALQEAGHLDEAEQQYLTLIKTQPDFVRAAVNLATVYREQGRLDRSLAQLEETLLKHPGLFQAYANIGAAFADKGWTITGMIVHAYAMSLRGDDMEARFDWGNALRSAGQLSNWDDYKQRFERVKEGNVRRPTPPPVWQGETLAGKRVLVWTEQGIGDEILHSSIIHEVIARAGSCIIECSQRLAPVFARSFPSIKVTGWPAAHVPVTPADQVDLQIPVGDLASHFRTSFAQFPNRRSFLKADPEKVAAVRREYERRAAGRRIVGISWNSRNAYLGDKKSARLASLAPLLRNTNAMFVNLQYGDCSAEISDVRREGIDLFQDPAVDAMTDIDTFFAQVAAMDLVITTSNTTAHVAGSLGVPVWIMLPINKGALWYWFTRRTDSPWYPSATLFRAKRTAHNQPWEVSVVSDVVEKFIEWVRSAPPEKS